MKPTGHQLDDCPAYFAWRVLGLDLYPWQVKSLMAIGRGVMHGKPPTSLVAANGSGKTQRVIAAAILWFLWRYPRGWCPVTSGSWLQVEKQLFPALHSFRHFKVFAGWTFNQTEIRTPEGGQCVGFSTDSPGRAEGWHPKVSQDVDPVFYVTDEAKTVPDGIFDAIGRCTLRFQLMASSPGGPSGKFYRSHHEERTMHHCIKATSSDCPHISKDKIERDRSIYGADHPVFRSMHLAEFSEGSELLIINPDLVAKALAATMEWADKIPGYNPRDITAFGDFAAGRDENVLAACDGRRVWIVDAWHETDTVQGARQFIAKAQDAKIPRESMWGDADGLGIGFCDQMAEQDYRISEFRGGIPAEDDEHYNSTISEAWFEAGRMIARGEIILCGKLARSPQTIRQLTTRMSQWDEKGRLRAEKKPDMAKRGLKSPDRADAILCAINRHFYTGGAVTARTAGKIVTAPQAIQKSGFAQVVRW